MSFCPHPKCRGFCRPGHCRSAGLGTCFKLSCLVAAGSSRDFFANLDTKPGLEVPGSFSGSGFERFWGETRTLKPSTPKPLNP